MTDPMWENPTEPKTEAGQRLIASFPADCADCDRPEFIRHLAQSILAIELEAATNAAPAAEPVPPDDMARRLDEAHAFGYREGYRAAAEPVPLTLDALTEALRSQDLYHHRHGTTPAGQGAAAAILAALTRPEPSAQEGT